MHMKKMIIILVVVGAMVSDYAYAQDSHVQTQSGNVQVAAVAEKVSTDKDVAALKDIIDKQERYIVKLNEMISSRKQEIAELRDQVNSEAESENILGLDTADQVLIIVISVLLIGIAVGELMNPPMHKRFDSGHPWNWL